MPPSGNALFKLAKKILGRLLGVTGAVLTAKDLIEIIQAELLTQEQLEEFLIEKIIKQRLADKQPPREVTVPSDDPLETTSPDPARPDRPTPNIDPGRVDVPNPVLDPILVPRTPPQTPEILIPRPEIPSPLPTGAPVQLPQIGAPPSQFFNPVLDPLNITSPLQSPRLQPVSDPVTFAPPGPGPLTGVGPRPVGSVVIGPGQQPQPQQQPRRRCQEVKRRRRKKGKCREGFFKEFPGKTRFTTWRETDCATGLKIVEK